MDLRSSSSSSRAAALAPTSRRAARDRAGVRRVVRRFACVAAARTVSLRGADTLVEDLRSTNGTFLDGVRIEMPVVLRPGAVLRIDDTTIKLFTDRSPERSTHTPSSRETVVGDSGTTVDPIDGGRSVQFGQVLPEHGRPRSTSSRARDGARSVCSPPQISKGPARSYSVTSRRRPSARPRSATRHGCAS